jgi:hypothetical protein
LVLFGRRPPERVDGLPIAGIRKPSQNHDSRLHRLQIEANKNGYHVEKHGDDSYGIIVRDRQGR